MNAEKVKDRIAELCTHFLFEYNGIYCGVDPFNKNKFEMWYDKDFHVAKSIDEVMTHPMFDGKSLEEICDKIDIISW